MRPKKFECFNFEFHQDVGVGSHFRIKFPFQLHEMAETQDGNETNFSYLSTCTLARWSGDIAAIVTSDAAFCAIYEM